jgi:hypothetical protein
MRGGESSHGAFCRIDPFAFRTGVLELRFASQLGNWHFGIQNHTPLSRCLWLPQANARGVRFDSFLAAPIFIGIRHLMVELMSIVLIDSHSNVIGVTDRS